VGKTKKLLSNPFGEGLVGGLIFGALGCGSPNLHAATVQATIYERILREERRRLEEIIAEHCRQEREVAAGLATATLWVDAYKRVPVENREVWLNGASPVHRNNIARSMGLKPGGDGSATIAAILMTTGSWLQKTVSATIKEVSEVKSASVMLDDTSISDARYIIGDETWNKLKIDDWPYDKKIIAAVWEQRHHTCDDVFGDGVSDFIDNITKVDDEEFVEAAVQYLFRRRNFTTPASAVLATWMSVIDGDFLDEADVAHNWPEEEPEAIGHIIRRTIMDMAKLKQWRPTLYVQRCMPLNPYNDSAAARAAMSHMPLQAAVYLAWKLCDGAQSLQEPLKRIFETPYIVRNAVLGADTTPPCFARPDGHCDCCVMKENCESWNYYIREYAGSFTRRGEQVKETVEPAKQKPNVIECAACPYKEPCRNSLPGFKPPSSIVSSCALFKARGVSSKPCYDDTRCHFELTPDDLGLTFERIGGVSRPLGAVKAENLAEELDARRRSLARGKK